MRRVRYSVATSLDGFISPIDGSHDWIVMDCGFDFPGLMASFDTVLLGRRTFEMAARMGGGGAMPGMKAIVFSRTLDKNEHKDVRIVSDGAAATIRELKSQPGKDIWLFGGGNLFASLLAERLVDRIELAVMPVLLGGGVPFLSSPAPRAQLKLVSSNTLKKGVVSLVYEHIAAGAAT